MIKTLKNKNRLLLGSKIQFLSRIVCVPACILILLISFTACAKKDEPKVIPKKALTDILFDLHKTEAILENYSISRKYIRAEKMQIYNTVIESHGYNRQEFDSTIQYYTKYKAEELNKIYEEIINRYNIIDNQELMSPPVSDPNRNLWNLGSTYKIEKKSDKMMIPFTIPLEEEGIYTIKAKIKVYKDDESINPRIRAYFWHVNEVSEDEREYFDLKFIKNEHFTNYVISGRNTNKEVTHLKGWLLYHDNQEGDWQKHIEVKNVEVNFFRFK